jgi:hypothetical protein
MFSSNINAPQQQKKDEEKKLLCNREGITLLQIPYWWDRQEVRHLSNTILRFLFRQAFLQQ